MRRRVEVGKPGVPENVAAVEAAMAAVGYYEPPVFGTGRSAPQELDNAIRQLQTDRGLKPDGAIEPNGPAAEHINALLTGRRRRPDNPSADTLLAELRREQAEKRARGAGAPATGRPPWAAPSFLEPGAPTLLGNAMRALAQKLARGAEAPPVARRAIPDNPSADTLLAELRREQAEKRARETGTPAAGQPPSGTPSFTGSGAGTLLGNAMRALAEKRAREAEAPPVARRAIPDNPSADTLLAELRREQAEKRTGLGDTPPSGRTRGGDAASMSSPTFRDRDRDPAQRAFEDMMGRTPEEIRRASLDGFEENFRSEARGFRKDGLSLAPRLVDHYLTAKGSPFGLTRKEARGFAAVRAAEAENRRRVERSFVERLSPSGNDNDFHKAITSLPDGKGNVDIGTDWWQVAFNDEASAERELLMAEPDFKWSLGSLSVNAAVRAKASREGDRIVVNGVVEHWFSDEYDFREVIQASEWAKALEGAGRARTFDVGAGWEQRFSAIIVIEDGRPTIEEFHWADTDRPVDWRKIKIDPDEEGKAQQTAP